MIPGGVRHHPGLGRAERAHPALPALVRVYLLAYNLASLYIWTVVLTTTIQARSHSLPVILPQLGTALEPLRPLWVRDTSMRVHYAVGGLVCTAQTLALVELLHSLFGWVRSPTTAVAVQLFARLWCVWCVSERSSAAASSGWYTTVILAWSISEVVRYPYYAMAILGSTSSFLVWARYTFFLVLYPLGCLAETMNMWLALPVRGQSWGVVDGFNALFIPLWWVGLYIMYSYMLAQRSKVLCPVIYQ